jgi:hypothetical protein
MSHALHLFLDALYLTSATKELDLRTPGSTFRGLGAIFQAAVPDACK